MPDIPASSLAAAEAAIIEAADDHSHDECTRGAYRVTGNSREFARVALEAATPILERAIRRKMAREILRLNEADRMATRNKGPYGDMQTSLRRLSRGEPLPDVRDLRGGREDDSRDR